MSDPALSASDSPFRASDSSFHPGDSPFHAGEHAVQARVGVRERVEEVGRKLLRDAMPLQHQQFFPLLPFIALGAVDAQGRPWATLLSGSPGFVSAPDATHLHVAARAAADDPLAAALQPGAPLGLLGIELPTRRRNRANGRIVATDDAGFTLQVLQSFGNCPKYIQRRELLPSPHALERPPAQSARRLDARAQALLRAADTFFIASHALGEGTAAGSDVSHRGGRPGFIHVDADGSTLTWPDFSGNFLFNTLGNLAAHPLAGLVVPDFEHGDLLHLSGRTEIVWDGPALAGFAGAQRLVRLQVDEVRWRPGAWPLRWRLIEPSPALNGTGRW